MEIERKFLISQLPDLSDTHPIRFERYYLSITDQTEDRIQRTNDHYSREKKIVVNVLSRSTRKQKITKEEFDILKRSSSKAIVRDSYKLSSDISIKIYHGEYEGLVRAEVEFNSMNDAMNYVPKSWMGKEITDSSLGRDSRLVGLDQDSFKDLLAEYS
jgi:adenylate cyclase